MKERGLLTAQGNELKQAEGILVLLQSIWKPMEAAIMHCRGHPKGKTAPELGNHFADEAARGVAAKGIRAVLPQKEADLLEFTPKYNQRDHKLIFIRLRSKKVDGLSPWQDRLWFHPCSFEK